MHTHFQPPSLPHYTINNVIILTLSEQTTDSPQSFTYRSHYHIKAGAHLLHRRHSHKMSLTHFQSPPPLSQQKYCSICLWHDCFPVGTEAVLGTICP